MSDNLEVVEFPVEPVGQINPIINQASPDDCNIDSFRPFDDHPGKSSNTITLRATFVGLYYGAIINASNVYPGLKTGWTFGANPLSASKSPSSYTRLSQAVFPSLVAVSIRSSVFISAFLTMSQLNLMDILKNGYWKIATPTIMADYFGFFTPPMRTFFIAYIARKLRLIFPTASTTAVIIRSRHKTITGKVMARTKMKGLSIAFVAPLILRVVLQHAPGSF
ncbi:hypothetical protein CC78DRAFT_567672 [Lojkania enalia]|uniref:Uncharacterized protein n=1 Tax=Lojkania enalia TaxID=147567 RepID=A0A9P4N0T8_9PLEO|nr:hypothetical protein CC78DRAFT_567672 [Didymosphaeria enalia]